MVDGAAHVWPWSLLVAAILAIPYAYREALSTFLAANHQNVAAQLGGELVTNGFRLALLLICLAAGLLTLTGALLVQAVSVILSLLILAVVVRRRFGRVTLRASRGLRRSFVATSRDLWLASVLWHTMIFMDVLMLGYFAEAAVVGGYAVCLKLAQLLNYFVIVNNLIVSPRISRFYHEGRLAELRRYMNGVGLAMAVVAVLVLLLMSVQGEALLSLWGDEFRGFWLPLMILLGGQAINVVLNTHVALLGMTRYARDLHRIYAWVVPVNFILNLLLIPKYGAIGAAVSTAFALAAVNLAMTIVARLRVFGEAGRN
jgi:O-antigen/teichoic acid export membrane protein